MFVVTCCLGEIRAACRPGFQYAIGPLEIQSVPCPQPVSQPICFPEARGGGKWDRIKIIDYDTFAGRHCVLPIQISAHGGGCDLLHFVIGAEGHPVGRVPIFLNLGCKRATAWYVVFGANELNRLVQHSLSKPGPFDGWIFFGLGRIQQLTVLDK